MLPRVVLYDAVSLDGRIEGFEPDIGRFYTLARAFGEDAILAGADTMLAGIDQVTLDGPPPATTPGPPAVPRRPLLAIVDSRGRIRFWDWLREQEYWGDAVALVSESTAGEYLAHLRDRGVPAFAAGGDHVDLAAALSWLADEHGVRTVRVESGGRLNTVLMSAGLADELSLLVHPAVADADSRAFLRAPLPPGTSLCLAHCETTEDGLVWLRYDVRRAKR